MNLKKHILVVKSAYPTKEFTLKKLKELNYYVTVLDNKKTAPDTLVDDWIIANFRNYKECIEKIKKYQSDADYPIDGCMTFWESAVLTTAKITDEFGWKGIPLKSAEIIKNKFSFRKTCKEKKLSAPRHVLLNDRRDLEKIKEELGFPIVIKPIYGARSAFVIKVNTGKELEKVYAQIQKYIPNFSRSEEWKSLDLYAEEYIEGSEVDIDILLQDGKLKFWSISDNFATNEPYFIETGQEIPSALSFDKKKELIDMASKTLKKFNVTDGCIHFEAKSTPKGAVSIEINLRMGGDEVYTFVKECWGVDLVEYAAKIAVGEKFPILRRLHPKKYLQGKYFLPKEPGTLDNLEVNQNIFRQSYVKEFYFFKKEGSHIDTPPKDFDYLGWVTVVGFNREESRNNLAEALKFVSFQIKPK